MLRRSLGVVLVAALALTAFAVAATPPPQQNQAAGLKAFKRAHKAYDALPKLSKPLAGVASSRRVATALDAKKHQYYVYVTQMQNKSDCIVLIQGAIYASHCKPESLLFSPGAVETFTVKSGLVGGVAENDVTKIVLTGGSRRLTVPMTADNGYIYGCPAPGNCAGWVRKVVGYNAAGKIVSRESVR